ncbi:MAG TPA: phosphoribosyltransferase family protein [Thermodesulfobacteriota bacterium]|nr:phosphoribosyltransferase family protein [Thermodesulfobacteriota bacterium]
MSGTPMIFADRKKAGEFLATKLEKYRGDRPLVVGLPRGGVVVADEVAAALGADLDVIIAGKLRAPFNPELAIGAITEDGHAFINDTAVRSLRVTEEYLEREKTERLKVTADRLRSYRAVRKKVPLKDRTVILVDDGLATGSTMISAAEAARASGAKKIVVAVPGGPLDTVERLQEIEWIDEVVCPLVPEPFYAVSQIYADFRQVEDETVISILGKYGG